MVQGPGSELPKALSCVSKVNREFFELERFTGETIVELLPSSFDLNLIENVLSIVKLKLHEGRKQNYSEANLSEGIKNITDWYMQR